MTKTMEFMIVSCLFLICVHTTYSLPKPINNILRQQIENIRKQITCGIDDGPGLMPFREDIVDVSHDSSTVR